MASRLRCAAAAQVLTRGFHHYARKNACGAFRLVTESLRNGGNRAQVLCERRVCVLSHSPEGATVIASRSSC